MTTNDRSHSRTHEDSEDRVDSKMAESGAPEPTPPSGSDPSGDGPPGQLSVPGYLGKLAALYRWAEESTAGDQPERRADQLRTERSRPLLGSDTGPPRHLPNHELFHESAVRSKGGLVRSCWVRAADCVKGKAVSRAGATCPNCCAFFATRDALAHHQCKRHREERFASDLADRLGLSPQGHPGAVSAQWHPALAAGAPQTQIDGVLVASLMGANRGLSGGRTKVMVYDGETSAWKWRQPDAGTPGSDGFLVEGGWGIERLKSDQPAHRPKTAISDPRVMIDRFLALADWARECVGSNDFERIMMFVAIADAAAEPPLDLQTVSDMLRSRGRGHGETTLRKRRKELGDLSKVLPSTGADYATFLRALANAPDFVRFVSRLRLTR